MKRQTIIDLVYVTAKSDMYTVGQELRRTPERFFTNISCSLLDNISPGMKGSSLIGLLIGDEGNGIIILKPVPRVIKLFAAVIYSSMSSLV
jgi:hypothetical protein